MYDSPQHKVVAMPFVARDRRGECVCQLCGAPLIIKAGLVNVATLRRVIMEKPGVGRLVRWLQSGRVSEAQVQALLQVLESSDG